MKTEDLISKLSKGAAPVKPLTHPFVRLLKWSVAIIVLSGFIYYTLGFRDDLFIKITEPWFIVELALVGFVAFMSALAACYLSLPDCGQKSYLPWVAISSALLFLVFLMLQWLVPSLWGDVFISTNENTIICAADMSMISILPIVLLLLIIKNGASTQCALSGLMVGLACSHFAYLVMRVIEANDVLSHLVLWHYLPLIVITIIISIFGKTYLKWR